MYFCKDKIVMAVVMDAAGQIFHGFNLQENSVKKCPRGPGDGYFHCKNTCAQVSHAEIMAIKRWRGGGAILPAHVWVYGANKICNDCLKAIKKEGLTCGLMK